MYIGIDVGGTNLKAGSVDATGAIVAEKQIPLVFRGEEDFAATLAGLAVDVMAQSGAEPGDIDYIGVGMHPARYPGGIKLYC